MSHSDIIIITVTLVFSSTFGVFAAIRVINRHTRPPVNTLVRTGDIELDYIEPSQQIHNHIDLLATPPARVYSHWNGNLPSYHTLDQYNINCYFESETNLDLWLILIFMVIIILLIRKLLQY